jgi:hypothetical protein
MLVERITHGYEEARRNALRQEQREMRELRDRAITKLQRATRTREHAEAHAATYPHHPAFRAIIANADRQIMEAGFVLVRCRERLHEIACKLDELHRDAPVPDELLDDVIGYAH